MELLIIIGLTFLGVRIFERFLPGARLMGPIFLIGFANIMGMNLSLASWWEVLFSLLLGIFFGMRIDRQLLGNFRKYLAPLLLLIFWYIGLSMVNGNLLLAWGGLDRVTSFLSVIPGGLGEVSIMALDYGADLAAVTTFQITRLLTIVLMVPFLVKHLAEKGGTSIKPNAVVTKEPRVSGMIFLAIFSIGGALLFHWADLPAGFLTGSLLFSAIATSAFPGMVSKPPERLNHFAQLGMGALIGTSFSRESFFQVLGSFSTILLVTFVTIFSSFILAWIFSRLFGWNYLTCFLGVVPGGIAPIMIMADQLDLDIGTVAIMQIVRLITAVMIIPFFYLLIL